MSDILPADMKPWQHGYELSFLKDIEKRYAAYNEFTDSPFAQFKKNNIAEGLHKGTFRMIGEDSYLTITEAKVRSKITMHGDTIIGYKEPGDVVIQHVSNHSPEMIDYVNTYSNRNCWLFVWEEYEESKKFARNCNFTYVGCKITTFGEIYGVYFRNSSTSFEDRQHPQIIGEETVNICKCIFGAIDASKIRQELSKVEMDYTQHYSNYNKKGAWSAISLRGYRPDPSFIAKPV